MSNISISYVRPDVVYRSGSIRPRQFSADPVREAYQIASEFTQDRGIVGVQYGQTAMAPSIKVVPTVNGLSGAGLGRVKRIRVL